MSHAPQLQSPYPYPAPAHPQARAHAQPVVAATAPRVGGCPHAYPLTERKAGFGPAFKLALRVLPYSMFRFAHWAAFAAASTGILLALLGLGSWLTVAVHQWAGGVVLLAGLAAFALLWLPFVERKTFGTKCAHIGLLTELITHGRVGNGTQSLTDYAKQIVQTRFGEMATLWDVHLSINRTLRQATKLLDFVDDLVPVDVSAVKSVIGRVVRGAIRYLDAVILSYGFARGDENMADAAVDGVAYCAQNSKKIFKTAIGVLVLEKLMMLPLWLIVLPGCVAGVFAGSLAVQGGSLGALMTAPSAVIKAAPLAFIISVVAALAIGGLIALLVLRTIRESLVQPVLTTMVMLRFHTMVEAQPLDGTWVERLRGAGDGLESLDKLRRRVA
jgi:hypothetical protein